MDKLNQFELMASALGHDATESQQAFLLDWMLDELRKDEWCVAQDIAICHGLKSLSADISMHMGESGWV